MACTDDVVGSRDDLGHYMTHEDQLQEQKEYKKSIDALAECSKLCPNGASRWFNEAVLENFEHTFEEILYYGTESN